MRPRLTPEIGLALVIAMACVGGLLVGICCPQP